MSKSNTTKYKYRVFFDIIEKKMKNGSTAKLLVDNYGCICGIYSTYKQAKIAMPKIRRNIIREFKRRERKGLALPVEVKVASD